MTSNQDTDFEKDFLNVVAHDLKTPISAVKGFIELIQHSGPLNESQRRYVDRAMFGLLRMEELVSDLLTLSRLESSPELRKSVCDVREIIQDALHMLSGLAARRGIEIHVSIQDGADRVYGDHRMLTHVINNLLSNAIKYNRENGHIYVKLYEYSARVRLDVRDTGNGIPEDEQGLIFNRFYRTRSAAESKIEGTGLGLSIADMIIQRHGGRIWVESEMGEGSTFSFTLPMVHTGRSSQDHKAFSGESSDGIDDRLQDSEERLDIDSKNDEI